MEKTLRGTLFSGCTITTKKNIDVRVVKSVLEERRSSEITILSIYRIGKHNAKNN